MADEAPQLSVAERLDGLLGGDLEVVEVPRQIFALVCALDRDVEQPGRAAVEALLDRTHATRSHDL
jgi:hypothetical protein